MLRPTAGFDPAPPLRWAPSATALVFALLMAIGGVASALLAGPRVHP